MWAKVGHSKLLHQLKIGRTVGNTELHLHIYKLLFCTWFRSSFQLIWSDFTISFSIPFSIPGQNIVKASLWSLLAKLIVMFVCISILRFLFLLLNSKFVYQLDSLLPCAPLTLFALFPGRFCWICIQWKHSLLCRLDLQGGRHNKHVLLLKCTDV